MIDFSNNLQSHDQFKGSDVAHGVLAYTGISQSVNVPYKKGSKDKRVSQILGKTRLKRFLYSITFKKPLL